MTAFAAQGFGAPPAQSKEAAALSDINSRQKSFANRDFVKNIAWLNNSVDMLSAYTQKLQKGVDDANQNAIEQIQGFASDLFVMFAGGEPTGIEIGDLKYVIQAVGALLGINPDTPFPLNLFEAAWHMFEQFIVPQQQFTDIIFDSVEAWAIDLGLSPELVAAMNDLQTAFEGLGIPMEDFYNSVWELVEGLPHIDVLGPFIASIMELFDTIPLPDLKPVLVMITDLGIPFIQALTEIVNDINDFLKKDSPLNSLNLYNLVPTDLMAHLSVSNIGELVDHNLISDGNFTDTAPIEGWNHLADGGYQSNGGTRYTEADGTTKELLSNWIPASSGQVFELSAKAKWYSLVGTGTPIQLGVTGYSIGTDAANQFIVAQHNTSPPTTDWVDLTGTYTVPANIYAIRVRAIITAQATSGMVYFSTMKGKKTQTLFQRLISGTDVGTTLNNDIENLFGGIMTNALDLINKAEKSVVDEFMSLFGTDITAIESKVNSFLDQFSPLNADNINEGAIADIHVPGLSSIHDVIVRAVGNLDTIGDLTKMLEVLTGQTNSVTTNASAAVALHSRLSRAESRLAALPISLGGTGIGISFGGLVGTTDTDDFERVSTSNLGTGWLQYYSAGAGQWATPNGHDAEYMWSGTSDREFICIRNNPAIPRSLTDYQRVTNVLSSKATRYTGPLNLVNYCGHNDVLLRISDSTTSLANMTLIRIRWGADGSISIVRYVNGVATTLKSFGKGYLPPPGPGSALIGEAGDINGGDAGQRYFRGIIGNSIAIEVNEVGVASGFGAAFRRWGHGGRVEGWTDLFDNGQERPGTVNYWNGMDQVFP